MSAEPLPNWPCLITFYALADPRDETIRYIGRTANPALRLAAHRAPDPGNSSNPAKAAWVEELRILSLEPSWVALCVATCESRADADAAELRLIQEHLAVGCRLLNREGRRAGHGPRSGMDDWGPVKCALPGCDREIAPTARHQRFCCANHRRRFGTGAQERDLQAGVRCACGCGERFDQVREHQLYVSGAHRSRAAYARRSAEPEPPAPPAGRAGRKRP